MSAFDADSEEEDDLPERIIVVREPFVDTGNQDAGAALGLIDGPVTGTDESEPAAEADEAHEAHRSAEDEPVIEADRVATIDLDEVDLRAEHEPLEADQAWLDALAADRDDDEDEAIGLRAAAREPAVAEPPVSAGRVPTDAVDAVELDADQAWLDALATADAASAGDDEPAGGGPGAGVAAAAAEPVEPELDAGPPSLEGLAGGPAASGPPAQGTAVDDGGPPTAPFTWPGDEATAAARPPATATVARLPERDETGPGTLRPMVPEPVIAARTISSPSRSRRVLRRVRALVALFVVVVLAGVGLAGAIGAAVLLVVLALGRAFGSGSP